MLYSQAFGRPEATGRAVAGDLKQEILLLCASDK